jgi:hypothetical protein
MRVEAYEANRVEQSRMRVISQSGSTRLGCQKGDLRSRFPVISFPFKVADSRSPSPALWCATTEE